MLLPEFDANGDLPPGVHPSTIEAVALRFGSQSPLRRVLYMRLRRAYEIAKGTGCLRRFVVFGSFITAKADPNDVDIFMIMEEVFRLDEVSEDAAILFDHREADLRMGISVFWLRSTAVLGTETEAIEFWQRKRNGDERGIVEILETIE